MSLLQLNNRSFVVIPYDIHRYSSISVDRILSNDDAPKIKVFASDDNLKALGELLSNGSSRNIIYNLMTKEMYTNEIATKLDMRVSLVIHHLKKLEDLGLLEITEKKIKRKGQEHRFFQIKSNIFVVLDNTSEEIKGKGFLSRIFKEGIKFASIGIAAILTFMVNFNTIDRKLGTIHNIESNDTDSLIYALIVVIFGLFIIYLLAQRKK